MNRSLLLFVPILLFGLNSVAQNDSTTIKRIVNETLTNATAYENLRKLCKQVGHRLAGSTGYTKAEKMIADMFREIGVDRVFMQPCMVPRWVRGEKERGHVIASGKKYDLKLLALGNSVGTGPKGITGRIIEVNNMDELHRLGNSIKGKIVFFNFPMNQTYIRTFQAYGESGPSRTRGPAQAAKYGAVGAMVRSLAINPDDHPHTGTTVYNDSFPKIPAVAISTNNAEYLSREIKKGKPVHGYFRTTSRMMPDVVNHNVIGEIRGSEFPDEIITVGGHLDSWDVGEGAHDDGTGVMQSMEVLRTLLKAGIRPKRTIRAVGFANEENGLRGGDKYLADAKAKNEKHLFALESDAGGFTPRGFSFDMTDAQYGKVLGWQYLFVPYGAAEFRRGGGGADIGPLKQIGTALSGFTPDSQRYFDLHHAETDVFEAVSRRELHLGAGVMTALIWLVSEYGL